MVVGKNPHITSLCADLWYRLHLELYACEFLDLLFLDLVENLSGL